MNFFYTNELWPCLCVHPKLLLWNGICFRKKKQKKIITVDQFMYMCIVYASNRSNLCCFVVVVVSPILPAIIYHFTTETFPLTARLFRFKRSTIIRISFACVFCVMNYQTNIKIITK